MEKQIIDSLKKFGIDFQQKCISSLLIDKPFLERVSDILDFTNFELESHQWIVKTILTYFNEYRDIPTLSVFKIKVDAIEIDHLKTGVIEQLKCIYQKTSESDIKFVKEQFLEFCRNQKLRSAILMSADLLEVGKYDTIKTIVDDALKAGMEKNLGHDYDLDIDKRMSLMARNTIKSNWTEIDTILDGGLASGELGIIAACAGSGKSWVLSRIGAEAMKQGKNVMHFTLELNENYVGLRYDSCFTGIDFQMVRKNVDTVKAKIAGIPGKLKIKYYPIKTASAFTLRSHIERVQMLGTKIDLVVVDYADILRPSASDRNSNSYQEAGGIYEELRTVAGELQVPIWSASQSNRAASEEEIIQANGIADSYRKIMTADFVMSLSRRTNDKVCNTGRIHIIKNRFGPDGMTMPCRMNAGCGDIQIFSENSKEGMAIMTEMREGENSVKKMIKSKWDNHIGDPD